MKILHVVHCIDTEGPLSESLKNTFDRLKNTFGIKISPSKKNLEKLQKKQFNCKGNEVQIANFLNSKLLNYITSIKELKKMLNKISNEKFRKKIKDDFGNGWVYSWHCVDHIGFTSNPRKKIYGYGKIFKFYKNLLRNKNFRNDEINWHFHPKSLLKCPIANASSYHNSMQELTQIICRRIIDDKWFPVVNRAGFHTTRPDSHLFLEQWIPYDYSNQYYEKKIKPKDFEHGRFGDWSRAPRKWTGYHPSIHDYQMEGDCRRKIFRSLNIGTRHSLLKSNHVKEAFKDARKYKKAILCVVNHDYRDMSDDIVYVTNLIKKIKNKFKDVKVKYSGAEEAARDLEKKKTKKFKFKIEIKKNRLIVKKLGRGNLYSSQPFLSIKTKRGVYYHDNLDVIKKGETWSYIFDYQTINLNKIHSIGIGSAGRYGGFSTAVKKVKN